MAMLSVPPRIALGEPMSGSSSLVSQMTSGGSVTGSTVSAAGAAAAGGSSAAKAVSCAAARKPAAAIAVMSVFMSLSLSLLVFRILLGIESLTNRFADEHHEHQRHGKRPKRRQGQP